MILGCPRLAARSTSATYFLTRLLPDFVELGGEHEPQGEQENAAMARVFAVLKLVLDLHQALGDRADTHNLVFEWIDVLYARERYHSGLGYRPYGFRMNSDGLVTPTYGRRKELRVSERSEGVGEVPTIERIGPWQFQQGRGTTTCSGTR
jgi:hypothetical protein